MFLKDNKCFLVNTENLILNCQDYQNQLECKNCKKNYYLNNNKCEQALANNCYSYIDIKKCETCELGFGLIESDEITSCVQIVSENCEIPDY